MGKTATYEKSLIENELITEEARHMWLPDDPRASLIANRTLDLRK